MQQPWSIGRKLFAACGALILLLVIASLTSLYSASGLQQRLIHTNDVVTTRLTPVLTMAQDLEATYSASKSMVLGGVAQDAKRVESEYEKADGKVAGVIKAANEMERFIQLESSRKPCRSCARRPPNGRGCRTTRTISSRQAGSTPRGSSSRTPVRNCVT